MSGPDGFNEKRQRPEGLESSLAGPCLWTLSLKHMFGAMRGRSCKSGVFQTALDKIETMRKQKDRVSFQGKNIAGIRQAAVLG
jgi:hypothetical protein